MNWTKAGSQDFGISAKSEGEIVHKSRIGEITIDCRTEYINKDVAFWSAALGYEASAFEDHFRFAVSGDDVAINLQRVSHEPRVHIDFETDNIAAEVTRLTALGAKALRTERRWVVMQTPTGHGICICQPSRPQFLERANIWP